MSYIDTALNLAWVLLCLGALLCHWIRERRHSGVRSHRVRVHRMLSVLLAAVSLFPCISASDDAVRLRSLGSGMDGQMTFDQSRSANLPLMAQLEDLEHAQIAAPFTLVLVLCFFLFVALEQFTPLRAFHPDSLSRGPPAF